MSKLKSYIEELKVKIGTKKQELTELESQLRRLEETLFLSESGTSIDNSSLSNGDILRYSRQLILPEICVMGQLSLKVARVLVVGCGGLGCPVAIYLAAAGVGTIGLVDYDVVEVSNLHRQVAHGTDGLGQDKCASLASTLNRLNPSIHVKQHHLLLDTSNAMDVIKMYDLVVDATDNVPTRYLLSDACVLLDRKPLVSGSALKFDGQLTVYNHLQSPCYRCIHPSPPPPNTVNNCSDGGVVGPVVGVIGCLQALEVVKIITSMPPSYAGKLLMYDGHEGTFRIYRLRGRQSQCRVCGDHPSITKLQNYPQFCSSSPTDKDTPLTLLHSNDRIGVKEYKEILDRGEEHILVDVREPTELKICQLPHPSINIRMQDVRKDQTIEALKRHLSNGNKSLLVVVCRRGNNSQKAVQHFKKMFFAGINDADHNRKGGRGSGRDDDGGDAGCNKSKPKGGHSGGGDTGNRGIVEPCSLRVVDIVGGFYAWNKHIDANMPIY